MNEIMPLVSIVMPAFNSESYIAQSIESVQKQTFTNWELLIAYSDSGDQTQQIVAEYAKYDPRIHFLENTSNIPIAARNRYYGIQAARGKWIAFLDSDDIWLPEKLEIQLKAAEEKKSKFLFTASAFIDCKGSSRKYILHVPEEISFPEILKQDIISCSSVLIEKELLEGCFVEKDQRVSEDFSAWIRILRRTGICANGINQPLLQYRISRNSISSNKLQSALRTFRTYRYMKLSFAKSVYYWCHYVLRSIRKYFGLAIDRKI